MSSRGTVLVVDDNREILHGTMLRLKSAGYESLGARDGYEGIEMATAEQPDAVLLDVLMPGMDGLETIRHLKDSDATREIPVVMLSASLRDQQSALEAGARFFLTKPCASGDLLAAVDAAIH